MNILKGRINRATYWLCLGAAAAIYVAYTLMTHQRLGISEVALIFVCVPRLHDIGRTGWLVLGPIALELVAIAAGFALGFSMDAFVLLNAAVLLVILGLLIWLGAIPGLAEANQFGEPPLPGLKSAFRARRLS